MNDITEEDEKAYGYCEKHGGHISVNSLGDWFCLRCWIGFFMGMSFRVKDEVRQQVKDGIGYRIGIHPRSGEGYDSWLVYSKVYGENPFTDEVKIISYQEAINRGPTVKPHKDGGPPYIFEPAKKKRSWWKLGLA